MAKKVRTWLTDDKEAAAGLDVEADQTVEFGLDGKDYEIDLCPKNATKLRNDIERWVQHARQVGGRKHVIARPRPVTEIVGDGMDAEQRRACREWLRNNTEEWKNLGNRGRIPADAMAAFHARPAVA